MEPNTKKGMPNWAFAISLAILGSSLCSIGYISFKREEGYRNTRDRLITLADTNRDNILDLEERAILWKKMGNPIPYAGQPIEDFFSYHDTAIDMPLKERLMKKALMSYQNETNK